MNGWGTGEEEAGGEKGQKQMNEKLKTATAYSVSDFFYFFFFLLFQNKNNTVGKHLLWFLVFCFELHSVTLT